MSMLLLTRVSCNAVQQLDSNQDYFQSYSNAARRASEILAAIATMVNDRPPHNQLNNLKHALDQLPSMCRDIETLKNIIADLTEANQSHAATIADLTKANESHAATIKALTKDNEALTKDNESHAAIIESHAATIADLTKANESHAATIKALTKDNEALTKDNESHAAIIESHAATIADLTEANESHAAAIENLETLVSIPIQKRQIVSKAATLVRATLIRRVSWSASEDVSRLQDLGEYMSWAVPFIIRDGGFYGQVPKAGAPPSRTTEIHEVVTKLSQDAQINIAE
ncbi:uncharacterized protein MONBRDRAFT_24208 [Monosiga brevicollis MX1]|uniref:Uncharacterized protein n=1 Tax=Monosiga brevicollis TaxID=81824 RepID=A9UVQ7_MONBE|nr:uncharacterized protein MONBRDRAFT_24208 [Monosiga brevicollis MX1]EDQ90628.1 predicted protein [Monosiga brevicollis MX1]|eukprot:XP_001744679.1 hypothetical protein [Monosiga brevicollis MX1]